MFYHDFNFGFERWVISKEFRILYPPQNSIMVVSVKGLIFFLMFDYFALGEIVKIGRNSTSLEM